MAERARGNVAEDGGGKTDQEDAAEHHQEVFEPIERAPFQMALRLQHDGPRQIGGFRLGHADAIPAR